MGIHPISACGKFLKNSIEHSMIGDLYKLTKIAFTPLSERTLKRSLTDEFVRNHGLRNGESLARLRKRVNAHNFNPNI